MQWILIGLHGLVSRTLTVTQSFLSDLLWMTSPDSKKDRYNFALYDRERSYLPGEAYDQTGLFHWERSAIERMKLKAGGRVLLAAAGGGREAKVLVEKGYQVFGFEPSPCLFDGANARPDLRPACTLIRSSYRDFLTAVSEGSGPAVALLEKKPFDAVILGWGSFSYVLSAGDRLALLQSLKAVAPQAPILASFLARPELPLGWGHRIQTFWRRLFAMISSSRTPQVGDVFQRGSGFVHLFVTDEIKALAGEAGYEVDYGDLSPYPHVFLRPTSPGPCAFTQTT